MGQAHQIPGALLTLSSLSKGRKYLKHQLEDTGAGINHKAFVAGKNVDHCVNLITRINGI